MVAAHRLKMSFRFSQVESGVKVELPFELRILSVEKLTEAIELLAGTPIPALLTAT